jgi:gluconolactonase
MKYSLAIIIILNLFSQSCKNSPDKVVQDPTPQTNPIGKIEIYDSLALSLVDTTAKFDIIGENYSWSEGPVWVAAENMLLFSDVIENKIYKWKQGQGSTVFLTPSGYTATAKRDGENGSNGLALDKAGRLLLCQSGDRKVARLNGSLSDPKPDFAILSSGYQGKKFNSPNDLVADRNNNIYFTDPIYGLPLKDKDPTRELSFEGVFKISAEGKTSLLIDSISNPNGIALSPDEKILYVASSNGEHPRWYAYQLNEQGDIQSGSTLLDATEMISRASIKQGADGFKVDSKGNIFSSGPDGINIISSAGKLLALIKIYGKRVSNCAFNADQTCLFITADDVVIRLVLKPA